MEKLPGVPLVDYWTYDPEKREKIRCAFRESLMELYSVGIRPGDTHRGNVLYDEKENKCWFIDYEDFYKMRNGLRRKFRDGEYVMWNMAFYNADQEVVFR
ncbi:hypothetical protein UA08_08678 [Talaromyces atroroseus]|uniref:Aminoglycoside phosphotransferase domain-containing protein n=1 Tax=Talaromyces atroroseus TaxID=1441469 RepID=A0A225A821_TALAT|nr:hypothetical protein UA08_08678 [Talaromyces atroroseus]OKL56010.1 hypothetical protein UA08_08678 [Talaromyces atroroseus]